MSSCAIESQNAIVVLTLRDGITFALSFFFSSNQLIAGGREKSSIQWHFYLLYLNR